MKAVTNQKKRWHVTHFLVPESLWLEKGDEDTYQMWVPICLKIVKGQFLFSSFWDEFGGQGIIKRLKRSWRSGHSVWLDDACVQGASVFSVCTWTERRVCPERTSRGPLEVSDFEMGVEGKGVIDWKKQV